MTIEISVMKTQDGRLAPASEHDAEQLAKLKIGKGVRVTLTKLSDRALKHHQLFFAGLVPLALEYWEPTSGLIQPSERNILRMFCKKLEAATGRKGDIKSYGKLFIDGLAAKRAREMQGNPKRTEDFLDWLKFELKYYDVIQTPSGMLYKFKSINFNSMSQEEFALFYKRAFDTCWNLVLSSVFEGNMEKCENTINELMSMG